MAYEPKTWECGEIVTAEALNHIEQGVADASQGGGIDMLTVTVSVVPGVATIADKSYEEIKAIHESGKPLILHIIRGDQAYTMFALVVSGEDGRGKYEKVIANRVYRSAYSKYTAVNYVVSVFQSSSFEVELTATPDDYSVSDASSAGAAWDYGM